MAHHGVLGPLFHQGFKGETHHILGLGRAFDPSPLSLSSAALKSLWIPSLLVFEESLVVSETGQDRGGGVRWLYDSKGDSPLHTCDPVMRASQAGRE